MSRPHVSIITDGSTPQGTSVWQDGIKLTGVQGVKTLRDGRLVEITIHAYLDNISGAEHPFEMHIGRTPSGEEGGVVIGGSGQ